MLKKYYQMELGLEGMDKVRKVRIPNAKPDLTLENVKTAVQGALDHKMFVKDGAVANDLKRVIVTEIKELA